MGYLGDVMGRSNGLILTVSIAAFSALFSAIIPNGTADDIYASIITIRFFLGVGLGSNNLFSLRLLPYKHESLRRFANLRSRP